MPENASVYNTGLISDEFPIRDTVNNYNNIEFGY